MEAFDGIVRRNRFTISVVFPVVGALMFIASAEHLTGVLRFNALLIIAGTLVMRSPLLAGIAPLVDRRSMAGIAAAVLYTYGIEIVGLATGFPYGDFSYLVDLGPMIAGVPVGLPLFFLPLAVNGYLLSMLLVGKRAWRLPVTLVTVLLIDMVLDPAAVSLGIWSYADGVYHGVPVSNFLGWMMSTAVVYLILEMSFETASLRERLGSCEFMLDDMVSFVILWGIVNLYYLNILPVVIAVILVAGLWKTERFDLVLTS